MRKIINRVYTKSFYKLEKYLELRNLNSQEISSLLMLYEYMIADKEIAYHFLCYLVIEDYDYDLFIDEESWCEPEYVVIESYYYNLIQPLFSLINEIKFIKNDNYNKKEFLNLKKGLYEKILYYGGIASDFLVQCLNHSIKHKYDDKIIITTSVDYPEKVFREEIKKGCQLDVLEKLVLSKIECNDEIGLDEEDFCTEFEITFPKRTIASIHYSDDFVYPRCEYIPTDEDREVTRKRVLEIFKK